MRKFKCINRCQWSSTVWKEGDILEYNAEIIKCPECDGDGCTKCDGTGRSVPPHHFEDMEQAKAQSEEEKEAEKEVIEAQKDELRKEIKACGRDFDHRWGISKLRQILVDAIRENKPTEEQAKAQAGKTKTVKGNGAKAKTKASRRK